MLCLLFVRVALFLSCNVYSLFPGWSLHCGLYYSKHLRFFLRVGRSPFTSLISLHYVLHKRNCSKYPGSIFLTKQRPQFLARCVASRLKYFLASLPASGDHMIKYRPTRHLWQCCKKEPDWFVKSKEMKKQNKTILKKKKRHTFLWFALQSMIACLKWQHHSWTFGHHKQSSMAGGTHFPDKSHSTIASWLPLYDQKVSFYLALGSIFGVFAWFISYHNCN